MQVKIENGVYRGQAVQGTFELIQDYTAFGGDQETRRNGRKGLGFLKIRHNGHLVGCVKNVGKVTVPALGAGYVVLDAFTPVVPAAASVARFLESAGWTGRNDGTVAPQLETGEYGDGHGNLDAPVTDFTPEALDAATDYSEVETIVQVMQDMDALEAELPELTGKERDNVRKTLSRRRAKLAALTA